MNQYNVIDIPEFHDWLCEQRDMKLRATILRRINQIYDGNFGKHRSVGDGVSELKINYGPGYRIYYTIRDRVVVILLCAGDKSSQTRDIKRAQQLAKEV